MYKALSTRIRTFLEPHIFCQDSCGRGLEPLWRAVSKQCAWFWCPNSLVSYGRKADSFKTVCGVKNIGFLWTYPRRKTIYLVNEVFAANCRQRYESSVPFSLVLFIRVYNIYSVQL